MRIALQHNNTCNNNNNNNNNNEKINHNKCVYINVIYEREREREIGIAKK